MYWSIMDMKFKIRFHLKKSILAVVSSAYFILILKCKTAKKAVPIQAQNTRKLLQLLLINSRLKFMGIQF